MRMRSIGSICTATVKGMAARFLSVEIQPIRRDDVAGKPPRGDEHRVAAQRRARRPGVAREPDPRGAGNAPALGFEDRARGGVEIVARLDLDEGDRLAALDDEIDFAAGDREIGAPARDKPSA